jgi:hypothetical protein
MNPAIIVHKGEGDNGKNVIQDYQKCIYTFQCKGNVLVEPYRIPEFCRSQFEYHLIR